MPQMDNPRVPGFVSIDYDMPDSETGDKKSNLRPELNKLLTMAEELQEKCDRHFARRMSLYMMLATGSIGAVGAFIYFLITIRTELQSNFPSFVSALLSLYGLLFVCMTYVMRSRLYRQMYRDKKALLAIVDMLREIEPLMAEKEGMSTLERAEVRIRLARLDIGSGDTRTEIYY